MQSQHSCLFFATILLHVFIFIGGCEAAGYGSPKTGGARSVRKMRDLEEQQQQQRLRSAFMSPQLDLQEELQVALDAALGMGYRVHDKDIQGIKEAMLSTWNSLPKDSSGRVERRSLSYVINRHFMQKHRISVRGLGWTPGNSSDQIPLLAHFAPEYANRVLGDSSSSYSIDDAVAVTVMLDSLIEDSVAETFEVVSQKFNTTTDLTQERLQGLVEDFLVNWMFSEDPDVIRRMEKNPSSRYRYFEDWKTLERHLQGLVKTLVHKGYESASQANWNPMKQSFSTEDGRDVAASLVKTFGSFWETGCMEVKGKLMRMDLGATGRIPLSKFHAAAFNGEWHFSESEDYLRSLGALDESSSWNGPRVIIANYLQSASNCIVTTPYYRVCCPNDCEASLDALEAAVGGPTAEPELLLALVGDLAAQNSDDEATFPASLSSQLMSIAAAHDGVVPLHGRLFAQWLHYVFPHECPYPHKAGTVEAKSPKQYGISALANKTEMRKGAMASENASFVEGRAAEDFMTMWSHEEELLYERLHLTAPWERNACQVFKLLLGAALALCGLLGVRNRFSGSDAKKALPLGMSPEGKCHFV
mmetsp:Transcript_9801/g.21927  ORF Transcript_9801/g.21927 Transcript_9801/m.21927 type:complete len:588 (+) Transcript_9801:156-1919(+)|eukprot:CAMPEP_0170625896 /NCGR_PEP_ID=MMETSP0224-20130122/31033_1 /TAXON_ID=285029 /ORGANISM="Togula jolla, Strain CCCM 725" /LENGTH=587 /DNA_ID=CAMNT_0010952561 /DNA_START=128 /DNA_END=1891 /DNA_ORIENTATION=-